MPQPGLNRTLKLVDPSRMGQAETTLIEQWCTHQTFRGFSARTVGRRRWSLGKLATTIGRDPVTCTAAELERWLASYPGLQTRYSLRADVHQFFQWAIRRGHATYDPTVEVDPPRLPRRLPTPVASSDVELLLATAHGDLKLMILLASHAGLRVSEIAAVHGRDAQDGCIIVRSGKGGRDRSVPMSSDLAIAIRVHEREIFPNINGQGVSERIRRHLRHHAIAHRPHDLRASFATALARKGIHIEVIAQLMGHESLATTKAYLLLAAPNRSIVEGLYRSVA